MAPPPRNIVFVGSKPVMNYVLAVMTQFNSGQEEVLIKARGKAISRAVDAAEIVRNRFLQNAEVKGIRIATENVATESGGQTKVSTIEIRMGPGAPNGGGAQPAPAA